MSEICFPKEQDTQQRNQSSPVSAMQGALCCDLGLSLIQPSACPGSFTNRILHLSMLCFSVMLKTCAKMTQVVRFPRDLVLTAVMGLRGAGASHTLGAPARPVPDVACALGLSSGYPVNGCRGSGQWGFCLSPAYICLLRAKCLQGIQELDEERWLKMRKTCLLGHQLFHRSLKKLKPSLNTLTHTYKHTRIQAKPTPALYDILHPRPCYAVHTTWSLSM